VTFKLALHPKSPSPVFFLDDHADEDFDHDFSSDEESDAEVEDSDSENEWSLPGTHWRPKTNHLRPGEEYGKPLQCGQIVLFASVLEKRRKGTANKTPLSNIFDSS
jgi:hypothetical protein